MHHAPADELVEGLAGGGSPWVRPGELNLGHPEVPEAEMPHIALKEALAMGRDAMGSPRDALAAAAAARERAARRLKEKADEAVKGGLPPPEVALE